MKYILLLLISLGLFACRSSKPFTPDLSKSYLKFGSEGGVTGKGNFYLLFENGQVVNFSTMSKTYTKRKAVKASRAKDLFSQAKASGFYDLNFSANGNMTYRIESNIAGKSHIVTWSEQDKASDAVIKLYQELNLIISQK